MENLKLSSEIIGIRARDTIVLTKDTGAPYSFCIFCVKLNEDIFECDYIVCKVEGKSMDIESKHHTLSEIIATTKSLMQKFCEFDVDIFTADVINEENIKEFKKWKRYLI